MSKQCAVALAVLTVCGIAARGQDEITKVEVSCAAEHVPDGLKAGARVDLMQVVGKGYPKVKVFVRGWEQWSADLDAPVEDK